MPIRTLVLIDGEHYPPVVRAAVEDLRAEDYDVVGAVMLGGTEKLTGEGADAYGVPRIVDASTPLEGLVGGIDAFDPDLVIDVSGSPVLDARLRLRLAAHALHRGVAYQGPDFRFEPPPRPRLARRPSLAVVATAKRSGKTALTGHLARLLVDDGRTPVVVAMGRGGPEEPEVIDVGADLTPAALVALADSGRHAASDHFEDALMARVPTVGTRRAGGGLAGAPGSNTFARGVEVADAQPADFVIMEGSGAAIPPAHADGTVCIVPATADSELITGYLGAYVLLLADLVVVTLADEPLHSAAQALEDHIRELVPGTPVVRTTFRPHPLEPISGRSVFFATTAPPDAAGTLAGHLESVHGARVVGWSTNLANRPLLQDDLRDAPEAEVLVTELKAAAVDVATKMAIEAEMDVVYCDNRPESTGNGPALDDLLRETVVRTLNRFDGPSDDPAGRARESQE